MKVTLGMICQNEEYYLSRILPVVRPSFDEFIAVDGGSTDRTRDVLRAHGCRIVERPWDNHFGNARNEAIRHATGDWMVMLDADEAMWPGEIEKMKAAMANTTFIYFPRYNFANDHDHWAPQYYPDHQGRAFRLRMGYVFMNPLHEILYRTGDPKSAWEMGYGLQFDGAHIYHYGACKPRAKVCLKYQNYGRMERGLPLLTELPSGTDLGPPENYPLFEGPHPLKGQPVMGA